MSEQNENRSLELGPDGSMHWVDKPIEASNIVVSAEVVLRLTFDDGVGLPSTVTIPIHGSLAAINPREHGGDVDQYLRDCRETSARWRTETRDAWPDDIVVAELASKVSRLQWLAALDELA